MASPTSSDHAVSPVSEHSASIPQGAVAPSKKGVKFWLIFASMCICLCLTSLEFTSVSTALPAIAHSLHVDQFTWVGSAYALSATAFLPMSGGLSQVFGRRPTLLLTICLFALGSTICGCASSMNMLIAGRTIQGLGGGGIQSITGIVLADMVSLQERGVYGGLFALVWCISASIGPLVGGAIAMNGQWRWLFYLNLPISAIASVGVLLFLDLPVPPGTYREKLKRMDWIGNFLIISSTAAYTIGLTWGGITAPWSSTKVLAPLTLGLLGLLAFFSYEAVYPKSPLVPFALMKNRTSLSGYLQTFSCQISTVTLVYFLPVYFQACKGASPVRSGSYSLAFATVGVLTIIGGFSVKISQRYRPQMWIGWVITIVAFGWMSTVRATDPNGKMIGFIALLGVGLGLLQSTPMYPIQAPLPVAQNASALSFMWFLRWFGNVWGVTVGSTVLQNELSRKIPASFLASVPQGTAIVYALIPELSSLPPEMQYEVRGAFASSLGTLWRVSACISAAGFIASFLMKGLPLTSTVDEKWTMQSEKEKGQQVV